jgi:hypothetical protein
MPEPVEGSVIAITFRRNSAGNWRQKKIKVTILSFTPGVSGGRGDEARRVAVNVAKLPRQRLKRAISIGLEPIRPAYIFAIHVSSVTAITKNANALPIFLFVC